MSKLKKIMLMAFFCLVISMFAYATTSERFSRFFDKMEPGENTVFVDVEEISIVRMNIDIQEVSYNVRVYLSTFSYNPSGLPLIDDVYQYHNVLLTNLDSSIVNSASIEFRIPKKWIKENNVDFSKIGFYVLEDNSWQSKKVEKIADDLGYHYYRTNVDRFAFFVITAPANEDVLANSVSTVTEDEVAISNEVKKEAVSEEVKSEETNVTTPVVSGDVVTQKSFFAGKMLYIILAGVLIGSIISVFMLKGQKKKAVGDDDLLIQDVEPKNFFYLADGTAIKNLYDLQGALHMMDESTFQKYVSGEKNDFANWITTGVGDHDLGLKLKVVTGLKSMTDIISSQILDLERKQLVRIISKKYGLFPDKTNELLDFILNSKKSGVSDRQIINKLSSQKYSKQLVLDLIYGTFEDIDDIVIHPEDEATIERFVYDAAKKKKDYVETKQDLLESGWPRFIVERKMKKHYNLAA